MIKKITYKVLLLLMVMSVTSCDKWLELKPQDGLVREDFWETKEQLKSAVIGCYAGLFGGNLVNNMFVWGEIRADMITTTPTTTIDEVNLSNAEILSTNPLSSWASIYTVINYCNTVIQYGPSVRDSDNTLTEAQLNAYLAEARGLRAMMYFYLLRIWGEVPLQLKASSSDSGLEQLPKSTRQEVYAQIQSDLDFALKNAPFTYGNQLNDKGRLTRYGIYAIQADVYLWMDKYTECIAACDAIINSQKFGLIDGVNSSYWYNTVFYNGNSNESIFELNYDPQILNPFYNMFALASSRRFAAAPRVGEQFYGQDALDPNKKDIRSDGGFIRAADNTIWKYVGTTDLTKTRTAVESYAHWMFYRLGDIYLLKAEASAWANNPTESIRLINLVRDRAGAVDASKETPDMTSPVAVSDYVLAERSRELAYEGKRWFDILRNAKRNNYAHIDLITNMIAEIAPVDKQQSMINKYKDVRSHYLPIYINELNADKALVQNPYYQ